MTLESVTIRLAALLGEEEATSVVDGARRELDLDALYGPEETVRLADYLIRQGGFAGILGRTLKIEALSAIRAEKQRG